MLRRTTVAGIDTLASSRPPQPSIFSSTFFSFFFFLLSTFFAINLSPFCSNLARLTDIGIMPPGRKGVPSKICIASSTEGSFKNVTRASPFTLPVSLST
uniref:Uncharacterized protein n=1 Tax=Rhizophora mucronata TaxID=61149 RepID=A0A2P2KQ38_RHIMU